jgi:hypothetical protein
MWTRDRTNVPSVAKDVQVDRAGLGPPAGALESQPPAQIQEEKHENEDQPENFSGRVAEHATQDGTFLTSADQTPASETVRQGAANRQRYGASV